MPSDLTNLLPPERRRALLREYRFRVATLALGFLSMVVVVHGILLAPSYLYMTERSAIAEQRLAELSERRAVSGFEDLSARITAFTERAEHVRTLAQTASAADAVRSILDVPRKGILVSSFTYTPPALDGQGGRMTISGSAATRESLRAFDSSLGKLEHVSSTDLPLSAYAKETDIPFSIMLTFSYPTP